MKESRSSPRRSGAQPPQRASAPAAIPELRPKTWDELVAALFADSFDTTLKRHRSPYVFRGTTKTWPLSPSLHRMQHSHDLLGKIEKALVRSFKKYAHHELPGDNSDWKWLAIAQHHGLPTRLLDWTFSPFVALHFATDNINHMADNGVVWMVDFIKSHQYLPGPLASLLRENFAYGFSVEMLEHKFKKLQTLERMKGEGPEFVVFFEPPSLDPRIVNQFGLFSLMNHPLADLTRWLERQSVGAPKIARRVIVGAELKWEVRDKLDQMNLTERVIYPGLDGLSQWLKRWYSPANPAPAPAAASSVQPPKVRRAKKPASATLPLRKDAKGKRHSARRMRA